MFILKKPNNTNKSQHVFRGQYLCGNTPEGYFQPIQKKDVKASHTLGSCHIRTSNQHFSHKGKCESLIFWGGGGIIKF